jgi:hypothetical protein
LLRCLGDVAKVKSILMGPDNLGTIFGPNLFKEQDKIDTKQIKSDEEILKIAADEKTFNDAQSKVTAMMIEDYRDSDHPT